MRPVLDRSNTRAEVLKARRNIKDIDVGGYK